MGENGLAGGGECCSARYQTERMAAWTITVGPIPARAGTILRAQGRRSSEPASNFDGSLEIQIRRQYFPRHGNMEGRLGAWTNRGARRAHGRNGGGFRPTERGLPRSGLRAVIVRQNRAFDFLDR